MYNLRVTLLLLFLYWIEFEDLSWQETFWMKYVHGPLGNFGNTDVSNNLVYTYDFSENYWSEFMELPVQTIQKYSCATQISKNGQINVAHWGKHVKNLNLRIASKLEFL